MPLVTLKDRGQITLPAAVRKQIRASIGDVYSCDVLDGKIVISPLQLVPSSSGAEPRPSAQSSIDIDKYIGIARGAYGDVKEIDAYVANERGSWE